MPQFFDTFALDAASTRTTNDGYLVANAKVARTGIQIYRGHEVERPDLDFVRVYRPEEEVFDAAAMASFAHRPLTNDHPAKNVDASTWRKHAVGFTSGDVARDGAFLRIPLMLADAKTIGGVRNGKREISAGYICDIDFTPGTTPDGEDYDARQIGIRANHLAIVARGRAGPECGIDDSEPTDEDLGMPEAALRTVTVDGLSISTTDQGAQMIERLQGQLRDSLNASTALKSEHATALDALKAEHKRVVDAGTAALGVARSEAQRSVEAKDGEIAGLKSTHQTELSAKDGEIAALKTQIPDATAIDSLIVARGKVIDAAKAILGGTFDFSGKGDADIKRAAVTKRLGDAMASKSDEFVAAAFETLTAVVGSGGQRDPVRDVMRTQQPTRQSDGQQDNGYGDYLSHLNSAWRTPTKEHA